MSLDRSVAGKYKIGSKGRGKSPPTPIIGCLYMSEGVYGVLIGCVDDMAVLKLKDGEVKKVSKKSLKIVVL